jgi:hypothetical protein
MRSKRSKRSKKFNLGTIFQMKNHSIAFEVSHFSSHDCSEKSLDWQLTECQPGLECLPRQMYPPQRTGRGNAPCVCLKGFSFNLGTIFQMKNHSIAFEASNLAQIQKKPMAFVRNE